MVLRLSEAMEIPLLRQLLRSDYISIRNRISIDNLGPVLSFVGKLGNPELGGVPLREFRSRQELYRKAEIRAMKDVPAFIKKAHDVFGAELNLRLKTEVLGISRGEGGIEIRLDDGSGEQVLEVDKLLIAAGRRPNLKALALDQVGIEPGCDRSLALEFRLRLGL